MPPLSDYLDNSDAGGHLSDEEKTFLDALPELKYKDSGKIFEGTPKRIVFTDPVQFFDAEGRELVPFIELPPPPRPDFLIEPDRSRGVIKWNGLDIRYR